MAKLLNRTEICHRVRKWFPNISGVGRIHYDTTDFFQIEYGDVLVLGHKAYLVRHNAKEGRFGLEDEVKFWVKRSVDLQDGSLKIIKLEFYEKFEGKIGGLKFDYFRSPDKEARILNLVAEHPHFMHGYSIPDSAGNTVRVIDYIYGKSLDSYIHSFPIDHQQYYYEHFPDIFKNFFACVKAIQFLHQNHEKHGDIRRDHIFIDRESHYYRWIDFDFNYWHKENIYSYDLFGLGNILLFITGKGDVVLHDLKKKRESSLALLESRDMNIMFNNRVANLKKIFPYLPEPLNTILLHFSIGADLFYDNIVQFLDDLGEVLDLL